MIKFNTPKVLNGEQLLNELIAAGVTISKTDYPHIDGNSDMWLKIDASDEKKAKLIVDKHIGVDTVPTIEDKLAIVGLTLEELKAALV